MASESRYVQMCKKRFLKPEMTHQEENELGFIMEAPDQYGYEKELEEYLLSHPDASVQDVLEYIDEVIPDGWPTNLSEEELEEMKRLLAE